jgi:hypothetical protein
MSKIMTSVTAFDTIASPDRDPNGSMFILGQGSRVQLHPACDRWMRGDRFGTVRKITRRSIHVKMDRSRQTIRVPFDLVQPAN